MQNNNKNLLYRESEQNNRNYKYVIFIGNGAVKNGNNPLIEWIKSMYIEQGHLNLINNQMIDTNLILASFFISLKTFRLNSAKKNTANKTAFNEFRKQKKELADNYFKAESSGMITNTDIPICIKNILDKHDTLVICLNWDNVFYNLKDSYGNELIKNIIQLHGICDYPSSMIFPCEFVMDYSTEITHYLKAPDIQNNILRNLLTNHRSAIDVLEDKTLEEIYFWGLSMNDYDAEVVSIINAGFLERKRLNLNKPKMCVINPDDKAAYRASFYTGIFDFDYEDPIHPCKNKKITI